MGLDPFLAAHGPGAAVAAVAMLMLGGFAKGVIGFALPLVAISGTGLFLPYEVAVGLLIVPTLVTNVMQASRNGIGPARADFVTHWRLNAVLAVMIAASAQLVVVLPDRWLFGLLGSAVVLFAASQLAGWRPHLPAGRRRRGWEIITGLVGGFFGGLSGVWGPPIVMYLLAIDLPKVAMVRVQALSYLAGSLVLVGAHVASGVLNAVTAPMSAALVPPAILAMLLGYLVQDRLDQILFRRLTLIVLLLGGLNMLRRALAG